ncbi:MAG: 1-deoxy-D-xylulose-5-phosphate synthase N-terminal domain-containing protein [Anaerolineaceae bacterium]|nr:1-deoxy-D-xylulose-5-phosphate synthase N-terminal domain-containing protein [Anaerolineaceae bacterium]
MKNEIQNPIKTWENEVIEIANRIRIRVLEHTINNNGGYMSQACSSAEIFATFYTKILNIGESIAPFIPEPFKGVPGIYNPNYETGGLYNGPKNNDFDRLIFSPSHYALVLYATLIETGRMSPEGLAQFNQDGSTVEMIGAEHSPGCEITSGSLGTGLSQAVGIATARKRNGEKGRVFVFLSDGEFHEGQVWEAIAFMSHNSLDNMITYVDINGQCCDGRIDDVMTIDPIEDRITAFGGEVVSVNAHDPGELYKASLLSNKGKPVFVLSYSNPTQGLDLLANRAPKLHYLRFQNDEEKNLYKKELNRLMLSGK